MVQPVEGADPELDRLGVMDVKGAVNCQVIVEVCPGADVREILAALGVRELSCVPAMIPRLKALVRGVTLADCESLARAALTLEGAAQVRATL